MLNLSFQSITRMYYYYPFELELYKLQALVIQVQQVKNQDVQEVSDFGINTKAVDQKDDGKFSTQSVGEE
jgi:hypothetical protein